MKTPKGSVMQKLFFYSILIILQSSFSHAKDITVQGRVSDSEQIGIYQAAVSFISQDLKDTVSTTTDTTGFYVLQLFLSTDIVDKFEPISGFKLFQNYPNPFNPITLISFELPRASHVKITLFNIRGQLIKVLADRICLAGHSQLRWDGTDKNGNSLSTGVYIYRLEADKFQQTRKMLLLDGGCGRITTNRGHVSETSLLKPVQTTSQARYFIHATKEGFFTFVDHNFVITSNDEVIEKNIVLQKIDNVIVWTAEQNPHVVYDNLIVEKGTQLIIEPGVTVAFKTRRGLMVKGELRAIGTETDSITFTVSPDTAFIGYRYYWGGIRFDSCSGNTRLEYCVFEKYTADEFVIECDNASPTFSYCEFHGFVPLIETGGGIIHCVHNASPRVEYSRLYKYGFYTACIACARPFEFVNADSSNPRILGNDFYIGYYGYAVVGGGFLDDNYIRNRRYVDGTTITEIDTSRGNPVDEVGDFIFTTTTNACVNVDGITNPSRTPHFHKNVLNVLPVRFRCVKIEIK